MELEQTESTKNLKAAWFKAKADLKTNIEPKGKNPHFKSEYIQLDTLLNKVNKVCQKHKLGVMQYPTGTGLITLLFHEPSGEEITSHYELLLEKKNAQGVGSALTYAKRQVIQAIFGLSAGPEEDDDGEGALEETLDDRITKMIEAFKVYGVTLEDLEARIGQPIKYISSNQFDDLKKYFKELKEPKSAVKLNDTFK